MPTICLNCKIEFSGNYCPECGQRASTERFTFPYFFSQEFLSATFNLDRGFFHTCLNLVYRPGHMIREYLGGRRKEYFNFIALLLVLLTIEALLWSFGHNTPAEFLQKSINDQALASNPGLAQSLTVADVESVLANQKFLFFPAIPIAALIPWLVFRRTGYNYLEHIIVIVFLLSMNTLLGVSIGLLGILPLDFGVYSIIYLIIGNAVLVFDFVLYWQLSRRTKYTNGGRLWRVLGAGASVLLVVGATLQFAIGFKVGMRDKVEKNSSQQELPVDVQASDGFTLNPED